MENENHTAKVVNTKGNDNYYKATATRGKFPEGETDFVRLQRYFVAGADGEAKEGTLLPAKDRSGNSLGITISLPKVNGKTDPSVVIGLINQLDDMVAALFPDAA